jgi:hypothetical protein
MKNTQEATHNHKRAGAVVVLQTTAELAKVMVPASGDEFWVKLSDLVELTAGAAVASKPSKKQSRADRPNASANSRYRVVRVA